MTFKITGLDPQPFRRFYGQTDRELSTHGVLRYRATAKSKYPDRIEMREAKPGETLLLLNHTSQPANTPYHARHAIFVREGADKTYCKTDEIPEVMRTRLLSLRGFDENGMMHEGDVARGDGLIPIIRRFFKNPDVAYIHVHNAGHGCYSGRIDRA